MENKGKKVLVLVEDDDVLARVLETVLTGAGYVVKIDYSGASAEETIKNEKPDCVLWTFCCRERMASRFWRH